MNGGGGEIGRGNGWWTWGGSGDGRAVQIMVERGWVKKGVGGGRRRVGMKVDVEAAGRDKRKNGRRREVVVVEAAAGGDGGSERVGMEDGGEKKHEREGGWVRQWWRAAAC